MGSMTKYVYIAGYLAYIGFGVLSGILGEVVGDEVGLIIMMPALLGILTYFGSAAIWTYMAWESVPTEYRKVAGADAPHPGIIVALFFVPCLNLIWIFVANLGLTQSINDTLLAEGKVERINIAFPLLACILQVVPYCNLLIGPIFWFIFMYQADKAREQIGGFDADAVADVFA